MRLFLVIVCVYFIGFFAHALYLSKTVYGDGKYYYAWLRSAVIDRKIDFPNGNKYSIGPALIWAPGFLVVHAIVRGDGLTLPYQIAVGFTGVSLALAGLLLLWRLLEKYFNKTVSIMTVVALAGATNLFFYGSIDTVNSHAVSFFAAVVYLSLLLAKTKNWYVIGAALGFLGLIRTQDLLYGILCIPLIKKANILPIFVGFFLTFLPQFIAWQLVYGKFWMSPYFLHEGFDVLRPHILGVLFNLQSGLFLWTPITIMGVIGLIISRKTPMVLLFLLELYVIATWSTWWQGASYSGRMFVSVLPVLAFGIASVFTWLARYRFTPLYYMVAIIGPLSVINAISIIAFLLNLR